MPDIIDEANDTAETFLNAALRNQGQKPIIAPDGIGMCLCCDAEIEPPRRWCGVECRDLWEEERERLTRR